MKTILSHLFSIFLLILFNSNCITHHVMRNSKDDNDGAARSLFLAGLMIGSVLVGGLFYDFESEGT